jgi:hypothetical protein
MKIEVTRYLKPDGYPSRYWAVMIDGELLVVTLYRKGAEAVADALLGSHTPHPLDRRCPSVDSGSEGNGR